MSDPVPLVGGTRGRPRLLGCCRLAAVLLLLPFVRSTFPIVGGTLPPVSGLVSLLSGPVPLIGGAGARFQIDVALIGDRPIACLHLSVNVVRRAVSVLFAIRRYEVHSHTPPTMAVDLQPTRAPAS